MSDNNWTSRKRVATTLALSALTWAAPVEHKDAQRRYDALVELAERAMAAPTDGKPRWQSLEVHFRHERGRAPLVMEGYNGLPEQTAEAFAGGWLHTGDVGRWREDGLLEYLGR